jgi:glycosyltransferase involved in cell wall biosynthesis
MIVKRHYDAVKNPFMKVFWFIQWWKMVRFERHMCQQFDAVVAVSEQDRLVFERDFGVKNVYAIPTGVDTTFFSPNGMKPRENSLVYVGAMDWLPNEDAIVFFAQYILPYVRAAIPNVTLDIVGRNPSNYIQRILEEYPEITIVGRVEDVRPYISQQSVFVLPLRIGGGTRIKVYEAMAMGKPIVSTRVGAEGLPVEHGKHLLLADQPEEFAESVVYLLRDPIARNELGRSAREFVETRCGWNGVVQRFASICSQVVTSRPSRPQVHGEMR